MSLVSPTPAFMVDMAYNNQYEVAFCVENNTTSALLAPWASFTDLDKQNIIAAVTAAGGSFPRSGGWAALASYVLPNGMLFGETYRSAFTVYKQRPVSVYQDGSLIYYRTTTLGTASGAWRYQLTDTAVS